MALVSLTQASLKVFSTPQRNISRPKKAYANINPHVLVAKQLLLNIIRHISEVHEGTHTCLSEKRLEGGRWSIKINKHKRKTLLYVANRSKTPQGQQRTLLYVANRSRTPQGQHRNCYCLRVHVKAATPTQKTGKQYQMQVQLSSSNIMPGAFFFVGVSSYTLHTFAHLFVCLCLCMYMCYISLVSVFALCMHFVFNLLLTVFCFHFYFSSFSFAFIVVFTHFPSIGRGPRQFRRSTRRCGRSALL